MANNHRPPRLSALEGALLLLATFFGAQWLAVRAAGPDGPRTWPLWMAGSVAPLLVLLAGSVVIALRCRPLMPGLGPSGPTQWWIGAGFCLGGAGGLLVWPTYPEALAPLLGPSAQIVWALLWVGLCAPVIEELFFRGVLQSAIARSLNAPAAVLLSAFAFALGHLGLQPLWLWPTLGLLFGALAACSGSLWPAMAAHIAWNLATVLNSQVSGPVPLLASLGLVAGGICVTAGVVSGRNARRAS
jgi:membrane protease YdiL (CAAX protease family)